MINLAERAHNHNWRLDPIVRSLLDTDFYKLVMGQAIWKNYRDVKVTFGLTNRTKRVKLAEIIDIQELREQLDYVKNLRFTKNELIWLAGNTFYGVERIFEPGYIEFLRNLRLPDYRLDYEYDHENPPVDHGGYPRTGQYVLTFTGSWAEVTFWEIYALAIVSELKTRAALRKLSKFELDITYSCAKAKLWRKLQVLKDCEGLKLSDMGTRRRHSFLYQQWAVEAAADVLSDKFSGTSNAYLAMKLDLEAIGTNAHELPMALGALAETPEEFKHSQYEVLDMWERMYRGNLLVMLPDTYGTTQFLKGGGRFAKNWRGARPDSKESIEAGEEFIKWWLDHNVDPREKLLIFADGLDVTERGDRGDIPTILNHFRGRVGVGFGWGTNLTNDFKGCHPQGLPDLDSLSLVCKVTHANDRPAVKLSDNYEKAGGPSKERIEFARETFGHEGMTNAPVKV